MLPCCRRRWARRAGVVAGARAARGAAAGAGGAGDRVVVGSVAWGVWRFYAAPPIFGYDPFVGYFAGHALRRGGDDRRARSRGRALYHLPRRRPRWRCARCSSTARRSRLRRRRRAGARALACSRSSLVAVARRCAHAAQAHARLRPRRRATSRARSAASSATAHFVLHYSPGGPVRQGHRPRTPTTTSSAGAQLERWFGRRARAARCTRYLFDNVDAEARAHGRGAHLHRQAVAPRDLPPARRLAAAGDQARAGARLRRASSAIALFGVARRGVGFNVGLIEGLAVAACVAGQSAADAASGGQGAARRQAHRRAHARLRCMGPRFFGINAAQAYNVAGSFCRFLGDTRGVDKLGACITRRARASSWRRLRRRLR